MSGGYLKAVVGTYVGGIATSIIIGINLIGFSALVGVSTFFIGLPAILYLTHTERVDPDRVFKAGLTYGVSIYLFGVGILFVFNALGIEEYLQPVRLAAIPIGLYLVIAWTRKS
jgi:hypothetical protein